MNNNEKSKQNRGISGLLNLIKKKQKSKNEEKQTDIQNY